MSPTVLDQVIADLVAEQAAVDALLEPLTEQQWRTPTPAEGWDVAHQVAHLAWTDEAAVLAATDPAGWDQLVSAAVASPDGFVDDAAARGAESPGRDLLQRWRHGRETLAEVLATLPAGTRIPWFGPPMSAASMATARFMETWAHGLDVAEGLAAAGLATEPDPHDRVRHVAHLGVRTRTFAYATHGLEAPADEPRVELALPSGGLLAYGPEDAAQRVTGTAWDFALLATQRRHRADTDLVAVGRDAEQWLGIVQAFAGPPGGGRPQR